jgi:hypothetical protein
MWMQTTPFHNNYHHGKLGQEAFRPCWTNAHETRIARTKNRATSVSMQGDDTLLDPLSRGQDGLFSVVGQTDERRHIRHAV